jgi:hypothetical protein
VGVKFESDIRWDGESLSRWANVNGKRTELRASRDMIHGIAQYNDAVGWEIERHKVDIFQRLQHQLLAT